MIKFEVSFIVAAIKYQKIFLMHEVNFLEFHCNFSKVGISRQFVEVLLNLWSSIGSNLRQIETQTSLYDRYLNKTHFSFLCDRQPVFLSK